MRRIAKALGATVLGLMFAASAAHAQTANPITWNAGLGLAMPSTSGFNTGFELRGGATFTLTDSPVWIRPEVAFDHFAVDCTGCGNLTLFAVGGDAGYTFETESNVAPYVLGGLQITHQGFSASNYSGSRTKLGINLGGGMTFPLGGETGYVELRYVAAGDFDFIPITFGLRF